MRTGRDKKLMVTVKLPAVPPASKYVEHEVLRQCPGVPILMLTEYPGPQRRTTPSPALLSTTVIFRRMRSKQDCRAEH